MTSLGRCDCARDPKEELLRRLDDMALPIAQQIPAREDGARILGPRRRHLVGSLAKHVENVRLNIRTVKQRATIFFAAFFDSFFLASTQLPPRPADKFFSIVGGALMACLTSSASPRKNRRTAIYLMTVLLSGLARLSGAHADERAPPPSLIARALKRSGYCDPPSRSVTLARFVPELHLRALVQQSRAPGRASVDNVAMAQLAWPLDRSPSQESVAAARVLRQKSAACESLVDRIVEDWRRRREALDRADDVAADEIDAELDALTGEIDP